MRKRIISSDPRGDSALDESWLDLESLAQVELTSEDASHPVESALKAGPEPGWQASEPGLQTVRLLFDHPLDLHRIHLVFHEGKEQRTQELLLRWSNDNGVTYRDIVRQQYNFSPPACVRQVEDYTVDLPGATALEITITPDISGGTARASMAELRLV
jgi:hypothetical protein